MGRKLYALLILIGTLGAMLLAYLYFFVYYTSVLVINANVDNYQIELFSSSTAQKWTHECEENICEIPGVSPFSYNISIIKDDYETQRISMDIKARSKQSLVIHLEKRVRFEIVETKIQEETNEEKIQRIKNEKLFHKTETLENGDEVRFLEIDGQLQLQYIQGGETYNISKLGFVRADDIQIDSISQSDDVFISLGTESYIYKKNKKTLETLPYSIDIHYIKAAQQEGDYLIVTDNGTFLYDSTDNISQFQYLFYDFVYSGEYLIGIVLDSEEQKKKNFNLTESGNLIIKYSQKDKTRDILYSTTQQLDRIQWQGEKILFHSEGKQYELINF